MILSRKLRNRETRSKISCAKGTLVILSVPFKACTVCNLWFLKPSFFRYFFTVSLLIPSWFPILLRDCSGSWLLSQQAAERALYELLVVLPSSGWGPIFLVSFCATSWFLYLVRCVNCVHILLWTVFGLLWGFWFQRTKERSHF